MHEINKEVFNFNLIKGFSAETSGGLLIMVPPDRVQAFTQDLEKEYGQSCWIIGELVPGKERKCLMGENDNEETLKIINVEESFMANQEDE